MADIAFTCGFNSIENFSVAFKKEHKVAPSGFRQKQKTQQDF
ncbi:MAG: helix-turn-helix domain-containing protein [Bacteroidota bacterium]